MIIRLIIGFIIGAAAGFTWHRLIGCSGGTCPITGNPYISTLYGAVLGALSSGLFTR